MRTCLLNAHVALKKAYEGSKDGAMEKAENDLKVRQFIPDHGLRRRCQLCSVLCCVLRHDMLQLNSA